MKYSILRYGTTEWSAEVFVRKEIFPSLGHGKKYDPKEICHWLLLTRPAEKIPPHVIFFEEEI